MIHTISYDPAKDINKIAEPEGVYPFLSVSFEFQATYISKNRPLSIVSAKISTCSVRFLSKRYTYTYVHDKIDFTMAENTHAHTHSLSLSLTRARTTYFLSLLLSLSLFLFISVIYILSSRKFSFLSLSSLSLPFLFTSDSRKSRRTQRNDSKCERVKIPLTLFPRTLERSARASFS